mmetsp:Transcript_26658/g.66994  ORF Transcript_26658/g.66994 Transcript_26658/m.66994 type:complete len:332 (-) Transcript_26658:385-1380(-)
MVRPSRPRPLRAGLPMPAGEQQANQCHTAGTVGHAAGSDYADQPSAHVGQVCLALRREVSLRCHHSLPDAVRAVGFTLQLRLQLKHEVHVKAVAEDLAIRDYARLGVDEDVHCTPREAVLKFVVEVGRFTEAPIPVLEAVVLFFQAGDFFELVKVEILNLACRVVLFQKCIRQGGAHACVCDVRPHFSEVEDTRLHTGDAFAQKLGLVWVQQSAQGGHVNIQQEGAVVQAADVVEFEGRARHLPVVDSDVVAPREHGRNAQRLQRRSEDTVIPHFVKVRLWRDKREASIAMVLVHSAPTRQTARQHNAALLHALQVALLERVLVTPNHNHR